MTVNLRIEGATKTLFEGSVTTDVRTFHYSGGSDTSEHECDATTVGGTSTTPVPTRGAALVAAEDTGLSVLGKWDDRFGPAFTSIAGDNVDYDADTGDFLAEYLNGQFASNGSCGDPIHNGDQVLFAYNDGSDTLLGLRGAATIAPGATTTLHVSDLGSSAAVSGATVDGKTSNADGDVTVGPYTTTGDHLLKATKSGAYMRSNAVDVCVTNGQDGFCGTTVPAPPATTGTTPAPPPAPCTTNGHDGNCGTTDTTPALGQIKGVSEGATIPKAKAPRTLSGIVNADASGLRDVSIRLTRNNNGKCAAYDGVHERFVTSKCGAEHGKYFSVGSKPSWSYLLPAALSTGRYVLDVRTTDLAGNVDSTLQRGRNRVVFHVT